MKTMKVMMKMMVKKCVRGGMPLMMLCIMMVIRAQGTEGINGHYEAGLYVLDWVKMFLGMVTIIGAFGFFITTSARRAHWPATIRRIFFGIFVFCTIITQTVFNVVNVPSRKNMVCMLGSCVTKISNNPQ